jgi:hypothetical protein
VQAMLPKRWAGSCKAPVTAAAAAATEHHTRPSVQGSADDVAAASSRSQLQVRCSKDRVSELLPGTALWGPFPIGIERALYNLLDVALI